MLSKEKDRQEEQRVKAIKVVDLLQHSAELGNTDALFVLAQISLVRNHSTRQAFGFFKVFWITVSTHPTCSV